MDPQDFERYIIGAVTRLDRCDQLRASSPVQEANRRARELVHSLEPYIKEACSQHTRVLATDSPVLNCTELRVEIAVMPADELRKLIGLLRATQERTVEGRMQRMVEGRAR